MQKLVTTLFLFTALTCAFAQEPQIERTRSFDLYGYTQSVRVGNVVYLSGITGRGPIDQSIQGVYTRIGMALKEAGTDFAHVVKENLFTTDIDSVKAHNEVRMRFYNGSFPAATWVQVDRLFMPEYNLEVEVIAVIPEGK